MAKATEVASAEVSPYLKQVSVRDYPPLRDAKVDFKPGLNIVIGKNGAGKTRFVQLVRNLLDINQPHREGLGCQWIIQSGEKVEVRLVEDKSADDREWRIMDAPGFLNVQVVVNGEHGEHETLARALWPGGSQPLFFLNYAPVLIKHGIPASLPVIDEGADWSMAGRTVVVELKNGRKSLSELTSQFVRQLFRQVFNDVRGTFPEVHIKPPYSAEWVRERIRLIAEAYVSLFNSYLPLYSPIQAVRLSETFQVYYLAAQDEYTVKGFVLEYAVGAAWLPFSKLSDGTKRLFYIITELLSPFALVQAKAGGMPRFLSQKKIILLEEPELGIHPDQLQQLLSLIREVSKENQVILTTHSPQVLNVLTKQELDRITICELDPEKGTQFWKLSRAKQAKARAYMRDDSYLSDFWLYSNLEAK